MASAKTPNTTFDLYVVNVACGTKPEELTALFEQFGRVRSTMINPSSQPGQTKLTALIQFRAKEDAEAAVKGLNDAIFNGHALKVHSISHEVKVGSPGKAVSVIQSPVRAPTSKTSHEMSLLKKHLPTRRENVFVTYIQDGCHFWAQIMNDKTAAFYHKLISDLKVWCPGALAQGFASLGQICAALFSVDEEWYRCRVIDRQDNKVCVRFIDYGNAEWLPCSALVRLYPELTDIPDLAAEFYFAEAEVASGRAREAMKFLESAALNRNMIVEFDMSRTKSGCLPARLFDSELVRDVGKDMLSLGLLNQACRAGDYDMEDELVRSLSQENAELQEAVKALQEQISKRFGEKSVAEESGRIASKEVVEEKVQEPSKMQKEKLEESPCKKEEHQLAAAKEAKQENLTSLIQPKFEKIKQDYLNVKKMRSKYLRGPEYFDDLELAIGHAVDDDDAISFAKLPALELVKTKVADLAHLQEVISELGTGEGLDQIIALRNEMRESVASEVKRFLETVAFLPCLDRREKLQSLKSALLKNYKVEWEPESDASLEDILHPYKDWRKTRLETVEVFQVKTDDLARQLSSKLELLALHFSPSGDISKEAGPESPDIDSILSAFEAAMKKEKEVGLGEIGLMNAPPAVVMETARAVLTVLEKEERQIACLSNELVPFYTETLEKMSQWLERSPDVQLVYETKRRVKRLKKDLRYKEVELKDLEDSLGDACSEEELKRLQTSVQTLRSQVHQTIEDEHNYLVDLATVSDLYFPELPIIHPDLQLKTMLRSGGLYRPSLTVDVLEHQTVPVSGHMSKDIYYYHSNRFLVKEFFLNGLDNTVLDHFEQRVAEYSKLSHPNLLPLAALFYAKNKRYTTAYILTPYHENVNIEKWLSSDPSLKDRRIVITGLLGAVALLHSQSIVHASITSDTVFVTEEKSSYSLALSAVRAVLSTFDFTRSPGERATRTPGFMGQPNTPAFDVYSLGLIAEQVFSISNDPLAMSFVGELKSAHLPASDLLKHIFVADQCEVNEGEKPEKEEPHSEGDEEDSPGDLEDSQGHVKDSQEEVEEKIVVDQKETEEEDDEKEEGKNSSPPCRSRKSSACSSNSSAESTYQVDADFSAFLMEALSSSMENSHCSDLSS